ncbi:MAG: tetratricopeptide repeat protein [Candidatus Omnitrophota bacterium]
MQNISRKDILALIFIAVLGAIVYANSVTDTFIWDDEPLVKNNVYIKSLSHTQNIFTSDIGKGASRKSNSYRPLQILTYALDYSFWRLDARGYHITNILLHIISALSLYWLISLLFKRKLLSFLVSIFFVIHPIHTEAVSYISGRADPLALLFIIISFIFYIKSDKKLFCILVMLSYICALLSRENSLIFPVLVLLYHYSFKKKLSLYAFLPVAGVSLIYVIIRAVMLEHIVPYQLAVTTLAQRAPGFFVAITNYMRLLILPLGLHMEYGDELFKITDPKAIAGILIFSVALYYAFRNRNNSLAFFSISWVFIALLPLSNLYPINAYMAEHWLYLPSIGFFIIVSDILSRFYEKREWRIIIAVIAALIIAACSFLTIKQNNFWRDAIVFYERTLEYAPDSARVYYNLANSYKDIGRHDKAAQLYKKAIEMKPDYEYAYNNFGMLFYDMGQYDKSIELYRRAIEINPDFAEVHNNLGNALSALGKYQEAISSYNRSMRIDPAYAYAYNNLGLAYYELNEYKKAMALYEKALELNPDYAYAYNNIGMLHYKEKRYNDAARFFKKAIDIDPDYPIAYYNMSLAYYAGEQYELSIESCDKAIELGLKVDPNLLKLLEPYRRRE